MNKSKADIRQIRKKIQDSPSADRNKPAYAPPAKAVVLDETQFRPQPLANPKTNTIIAWAVFAVTLIVYLLTQARTASFWDSGEYATCISILGVPHPPGNPFYILFGRALVSLFGGIFSHAWIAAFISGLASAFAVMFTYLVTVQLTSMFKLRDWEAMFAGVVAALLTAFSFTFWMNAVEAEVYSGLVFFVNIIIWLTLWWVQHSRDFHRQNILLLIVYLFFLGFGVHQTALQIAPAILFIVVYPLLLQGAKKGTFWYKFFGYGAALILSYLIFGAIGKGMKMDSLDQIGLMLCVIVLMAVELHDVLDRRLWFLAVGLVLVGISSHLYIPIRAADKPFINLGNPSSTKLFQDYLQRKQYKPEEETSMFDRRGAFFKHQLGFHFLRYFGWQWFKPEAVRRATKIPETVVNLFGGLFVAFLGLFGAVFHFRKNKHSFHYLLAIMLCVTLLMVFVMNLSDSEVRERDYFFVVAYNMWAIWMGIGALGLVSLFKSKAAKAVLAALLLLLPVLNMAVQYREHDRSREFIALDYGVNFLNSVEDNAIIFTNGDNDTYPPLAMQTLTGLRPDVRIVNISLLNTTWYARRMRDSGVPISLDDAALEALKPKSNDLITTQLQRHILEGLARAGWPRPVLYSVTVPDQNRVKPCSVMLEGVLARVVALPAAGESATELDLARSRELLDTVYRLDSITDPLGDWKREASVARMGWNYVAMLAQIGQRLYESSPKQDGGPYFHRAVALLAFHENAEAAGGILKQWESLDPGAPLLARARALVSGG